jgi:hypothetical protein
MDDVLPLIYQDIDDASDVANMFYVCKTWRNLYGYCALQLCKRKFVEWVSIVNVQDSEDVLSLVRRQVFSYNPNDYVPTKNEGFDLITETHIRWFYPFQPEFPLDFFEPLIEDVSFFRTMFRRYNLDGIENHMCITPDESEYNAFVAPQEWFPFYFKDGVIFGVNVGSVTPSVIGIVIYLEEQSTNRITDVGTAFTIIEDWERITAGANGFVFADNYLRMLDLEQMDVD